MNSEFFVTQWDKLSNWAIHSGGTLVLAILLLWVGLKVIKLVRKSMYKVLEKRNIDASLRGFLVTLGDAALKVLLIITAMSMIGIEMTSFIAIIGAAGLAVGIALQGTLQNFAGGVIILILRPYKVGDFIETSSFSGTVKHIQIFHTLLGTADNKQVIIPNSELATKSIINYTKSDTRRVDFDVSIAYGESVDKAREILLHLAENQSQVLQQEEVKPAVVLCKLSDSSVDISLRVWVSTPDYWDVTFDLKEKIYRKFTEEKIHIPFRQLQVHMAPQKNKDNFSVNSEQLTVNN